MSKTDDIIKRELGRTGDNPPLFRRVFVGSSKHDQKLWHMGGLSFGRDGVVYGSNDFAWYKKEKWYDRFSKTKIDSKPVIVIEGSHCLNTKSWGNAQLQRFHHAYGALLNNVLAIYYLKKGKYPIRPDLMAAALSASDVHSDRPTVCYLITDDISDIEQVVKTMSKYGEDSKELEKIIYRIKAKMNKVFLRFFNSKRFGGDWVKYLESRDVIKSSFGWFKIRGPRYKNFTDSSFRMGHIVVGEALITKYLLIKAGINLKKEPFYYLFPFLEKSELEKISVSKSHDKEWKILRSSNAWKILTVDDLAGLDKDFENKLRTIFKTIDLNKNRRMRNEAVSTIREGLISGEITIKKNG